MSTHKSASNPLWRQLRILALLLVLLFVATDDWLTRLRATDWSDSLWVVVYPIAADDSDQTRRYIASLQSEELQEIRDFFRREGARYGVRLDEPVVVALAPALAESPPAPDPTGGVFSNILWSLQLRYWSWRHDNYPGPHPDVRIFVQYHDPVLTPALSHSVGLTKGMIALVNAFARDDMNGSNNVVIAHELLHTLGALDKYHPQSGVPMFPLGFADPQQQPLYPQSQAEIMGGRIPVSATQAKIPRSLADVVVGPQTAAEVRWPAAVAAINARP